MLQEILKKPVQNAKSLWVIDGQIIVIAVNVMQNI